jgi:hypothetical protein
MDDTLIACIRYVCALATQQVFLSRETHPRYPRQTVVFIRRVDGGSLQKLAGDLWENPAQLPAIIFDELLQTGMIAKIDSDGDCYQLTDAARKLGLLLDQR